MRKTLTPFGTALRELRLNEDKSLVFVADVLGCSIAHASAIERGVKNPPTDQDIEKILKAFGRTDLISEWRLLAAKSRKHVEINLDRQDDDVANLLVSLARTCNENGLDNETARAIKDLLDKRKKQR